MLWETKGAKKKKKNGDRGRCKYRSQNLFITAYEDAVVVRDGWGAQGLGKGSVLGAPVLGREGGCSRAANGLSSSAGSVAGGAETSGRAKGVNESKGGHERLEGT